MSPRWLRSAPVWALWLFVPGCAGGLNVSPQVTPRASAEELQEQAEGVMHVIQPGQTLWRVARAYDVPLDVVVAANGIEDPSRVEAGTPVFIPGARMTLDVQAYPAPLPRPGASRPFRSDVASDFLWPVADGALLRPYGEQRRTHRHAGVDIRGVRGQPILAARDGVVAFAGSTEGGYGSMVVIDHGDGVQSLYGHAQETLVAIGSPVRRGETIALVGRTGNATSEHCHFEIRLENRPVDPMPYFAATTEARR